MYKIFLLFALSVISLKSYSASIYDASQRSCITIGVLQGGGSLIGFDVEELITDQLGIQLGAGLFGYGGGLNYHFRQTIRSSFVSMQYIHQGPYRKKILEAEQAFLSGTYVYRARRWFTFQIGLGYSLDSNRRDWSYQTPEVPIFLMYSIGAYIPW